jgi:hypothetical protein
MLATAVAMLGRANLAPAVIAALQQGDHQQVAGLVAVSLRSSLYFRPPNMRAMLPLLAPPSLHPRHGSSPVLGTMRCVFAHQLAAGSVHTACCQHLAGML